jgi:hypothetical protein
MQHEAGTVMRRFQVVGIVGGTTLLGLTAAYVVVIVLYHATPDLIYLLPVTAGLIVCGASGSVGGLLAGLWMSGRIETRRRRNQMMKGHCYKCDYDMRGSASSGCPECGFRNEVEAMLDEMGFEP